MSVVIVSATCAGCGKEWVAGHVCPTPPNPWWKRRAAGEGDT